MLKPRAPSVAGFPALSRFACSDWFLSLSGFGYCAFGGANNSALSPSRFQQRANYTGTSGGGYVAAGNPNVVSGNVRERLSFYSYKGHINAHTHH